MAKKKAAKKKSAKTVVKYRTRTVTKPAKRRKRANPKGLKVAGYKVKGIDSWLTLIIAFLAPLMSEYTPEQAKTRLASMGLPPAVIPAVALLLLSQFAKMPYLASAGVLALGQATLPKIMEKLNIQPPAVSGMGTWGRISGRRERGTWPQISGPAILRAASGPAQQIIEDSTYVPDVLTRKRARGYARPFDAALQRIANPTAIKATQRAIDQLAKRGADELLPVLSGAADAYALQKMAGRNPNISNLLPAAVAMYSTPQGRSYMNSLPHTIQGCMSPISGMGNADDMYPQD